MIFKARCHSLALLHLALSLLAVQSHRGDSDTFDAGAAVRVSRRRVFRYGLFTSRRYPRSRRWRGCLVMGEHWRASASVATGLAASTVVNALSLALRKTWWPQVMFDIVERPISDYALLIRKTVSIVHLARGTGGRLCRGRGAICLVGSLDSDFRFLAHVAWRSWTVNSILGHTMLTRKRSRIF
jgi:hypothetical protein